MGEHTPLKYITFVLLTTGRCLLDKNAKKFTLFTEQSRSFIWVDNEQVLNRATLVVAKKDLRFWRYPYENALTPKTINVYPSNRASVIFLLLTLLINKINHHFREYERAYSCLNALKEFVVCIYNIFDNKFKIKIDFNIRLKESCWY